MKAALAANSVQFAIKGIAVQTKSTLGDGQDDVKETPEGDAQAITLAVSNLLENALDFAPAQSTVTIRIGARSISVHDQGLGVPDYALPHLGERFFTPPRPNGQRSGSGLGLAIVRQIMALHGGTLRIRNAGGLFAEMLFQAPTAN